MICDYCTKPFEPREAKQRFCTRECSQEFWKEERRQAMELRRQQRLPLPAARSSVDPANPIGFIEELPDMEGVDR